MRVVVSLWRTGAAVATLAVLGLTIPPAAASSAIPPATASPAIPPATAGSARPPATKPTSAQSQPTDHSIVSLTHSPHLLRQLAGAAAGPAAGPATGAVSSRLTGPPSTAGAIAGAMQGVDVASFQHPNGAPIDWSQAAAAGIQFAAVKVTQGAYYQNKTYALTDLAGAQAAGLSVMAYAFAIPGDSHYSTDPVVQADYLLSYLGTANAGLPIMLDLEYDPYSTKWCYGLSPAAMVSWISAFSAEVRARTGRFPIIYTPADWWKKCTGSTNATNGSTAFGQDPLWIPQYASSGSPSLPAGWGRWSFWQYSSTGTVPGINTPGGTDLDQLNPAVIPLLDPWNQHKVAGTAVDWQLTRADPVAGQTPSFSAAGLPAGISVSAGGRVTGWPDRPGTYPVKVTATDSQGASGSVSFTWTVQPAPDAGPTGPVRLDAGGTCLNDSGNRSANGTPVNIWRCNASAAQRWHIAADDTVRIHGKCLDVRHSGTASGTPVDLYTCNGSGAQQWQVGTGGELVNPASRKCLADPRVSTANGTRLQIKSCTGNAHQKWTLPAGPVVSQIPGMCLDDSGNATADGTPADLSACDGTAAQAWTAEPDGTVRIHGKCLDVYQSGTASGTPVDLSTCNGTGAQRWHAAADGPGVSLVNSASGLCLADPGDATASGTRLEVITCAASDPGMAWRVH